MEHEVSDRNEWFKDVKRLIRGLEVKTVEDPFACPTVKSVTDGEDEVLCFCHSIATTMTALETVAMVGRLVPWFLESNGCEDK